MRKCFIALVAILIILSVCIAGCSSDTPSVQPTPQPTTLKITYKPTTLTVTSLSTPASQLSTFEPSDMALQLTDLPQSFTIAERSERTKSDVSQWSRDNGWTNGYYVRFIKLDPSTNLGMSVEQAISIYQLDKINTVLPHSQAEYLKLVSGTITVDQLSDPKIGELSQAFRITKSTESNIKSYILEFTKNGVYEVVTMTGPTTDYELLKDLAKKAAAKIK